MRILTFKTKYKYYVFWLARCESYSVLGPHVPKLCLPEEDKAAETKIIRPSHLMRGFKDKILWCGRAGQW